MHIESNGEVKDYESDNGGNVNLESSDGHARVQITEHSVSLSASPTPSVTISPAQILVEDKKKLQEKVKGLQAKIQEKNRNFFQRILSFFRNLFFHR